MVVYLITCIPTGKKYVGKTVQTSHARWRQWRTEARIGRKDTPLLRAIREHGPAAFTVEDLAQCDSQAKLDAKERRWIAELGTKDPEKGYNVQGAGGGARKLKKSMPHAELAPDHKQKISASLLAYYASLRTTGAQFMNGGGKFECQMIHATL